MKGRSIKELLIIRHAESIANSRGILAGQIDPTPLSSKGRQQAKQLQDVLAKFEPERIISSPMLRCRQTADLAGASDLILDDRLIEMDYGNWSGKKLSTLSKLPGWSRIQKDPENFTFPRGESFQSALARIREILDELRQSRFVNTVLFTHGDISRILINDLLGRDLNRFQEIMIEPSSHSRISVRQENGSVGQKVFLLYLNRREVAPQSVSRGFTLGGES